jgi:glycosyltransferase involved in cell wall biosynthesis
MKKMISVCIPCRNEVNNVHSMAKELIALLQRHEYYEFEIIFIDNYSDDGTRDKLREICAGDKRIKAILNAKNFPEGSGLHVLFQAHGDCIISIPADFQVPVNLIDQMIEEWEKGAKVVALTKITAQQDKVKPMRKLYYAISRSFSNEDVLIGFTGSGLYDKSFMDICKMCHDPMLSIRYMVTHYAASLKKLEYMEKPRRSGRSKHSAGSLINVAIMRFIRISDIAPHFSIVIGLFMGIASMVIALYYLVRKIIDWGNFPMGTAPLVIGMFFLGAIQLIFLGLMGEYIMMINKRQKNEPRVVESERINFTSEQNVQENQNA